MSGRRRVGLDGNGWLAPPPIDPPPPQKIDPPPPQQVEPPPQQQHQYQVHTSTIDSSTALHQGENVQELGSEEEIVRQFYRTIKEPGKVTEEISMYRYFMKTPNENSWADGELSTYSFGLRKWANKINVKFYILKVLNKEQAAEISDKVDELLLMQNYKNVFVPIFQVYNDRVKSVIICYPHFDLHLKDQLKSGEATSQNAGTNLLQPFWCSFIRDTLSCIEPIDEMAISKFGDMSSYVWKKTSNCIKIIIFPMVTKTNGVKDTLLQFADLLSNEIHAHWLNPGLKSELNSFISFLKAWPENPQAIRQFWVNLAGHPLLLDYDGMSSLIARTWRPKLTKNQISELESHIIYPLGILSWKSVPITDHVMKTMFSEGFTDDPHGFFTFIKVLAAHYPENYRKLGYKDPNGQQHPVSLIKNTYPWVSAQIYLLSKKTRWLE